MEPEWQPNGMLPDFLRSSEPVHLDCRGGHHQLYVPMEMLFSRLRQWGFP
jgi:hypothetical protein